MKIAVGSDHAGYELKARLLEPLRRMGYTVRDFGCHDTNPVDFPDVAAEVCAAVLRGECERGIMFCGTGVGACIACNKTAGVRAALCHDLYSAHQCVEHDNVQVLALGAQVIGPSAALELIGLFLTARFLPDEAFRRRVQKLEAMDVARGGTQRPV